MRPLLRSDRIGASEEQVNVIHVIPVLSKLKYHLSEEGDDEAVLFLELCFLTIKRNDIVYAARQQESNRNYSMLKQQR